MPERKEFSIRLFRSEDEAAVIELWKRCDLVRPWNNPHQDVERKIVNSPTGFFVGEIGGEVVAAMMVGYDGHRGWVNYLAVDPNRRMKGLGRLMMERAEEVLLEWGAPKINLLVRGTNQAVQAFYIALGYKVDDVVELGKRLVVDQPFD